MNLHTIRPPTDEQAGHRQEAEVGYIVAQIRRGCDPVPIESCKSRAHGTRLCQDLCVAHPGSEFGLFAAVATYVAEPPGKDAVDVRINRKS
jgi:hypothetical protein